MKMAKPSQRDIDAAGDALSILIAIDRGDYPITSDHKGANVPAWFDEDDPDHLRHFYDAMKATLETGWPGRVIGGMCYVIMNPENEILDPASETLDLHPKFTQQAADLAIARAMITEAHDALALIFTGSKGKDLSEGLVPRMQSFLKDRTK